MDTKAKITTRYDLDLLARIDAEVMRLQAASPGVTVDRSDAIRALILRGLSAPVRGPRASSSRPVVG